MKRCLGIAALMVCLAPVASTMGGPAGPTVYVSLIDEHQIAAVDVASGTVSVIYTGDEGFRPAELVVGPDERLYVADADADRIWRMEQDGTGAQIVLG